jgi:hypothetical protein
MNHRPLKREPCPCWARLGVLIVASTFVLASCRSGAGPAPAASRHRFAAYRQCLEQHGVTRPPPGADRRSISPANAAAFAAARKACRSLRPAGGLRDGAIDSNARAAFRKCMTDHGVTLPAPSAAGPGPGASSAARGGILNGLDRNDPAVAKALTSCRSLLVRPSTSTSTRPK